jgi:hypothetical protein
MFADDLFLFGAELKWIWRRQRTREFGRHALGGLTARGEDQNRPEVFGQRLGEARQ